jgi:hypothetical protein
MFEELDSSPRRPTLQRWFGPADDAQPVLIVRWLFLRALGAIFFSAFYALWFQIHGLIGPRGILPAGSYLQAVHDALGARGYWLAPSLLWLDASDTTLTALMVAGLLASVALVLNLWPRMSIAVALVAFLSFVAAAQDFSSYQSDGMLLEAAFLSLFFAPPGLRPKLGAASPPSRAALWLLRWEWFRIYFESGVVKIASGEVQWRDLTAMDRYYENAPLPTWIAWHVQQFPHWFHATSAALTLIIELFICWLVFFPKRSRLIAFLLTTPFQLMIIATGNYAFLNYIVVALGIVLLSDRDLRLLQRRRTPVAEPSEGIPTPPRSRASLVASAAVLIVIAAASIGSFVPLPLFATAAQMVAPFRIANSFGLFAVMTRGRYEVEFQGTVDGKTWLAYPFRYKPQDVRKAPGIYAPYQPRFEWNLWFASLAPWDSNAWVVNAEERLMEREPSVLQLFARDPFNGRAPIAVRTVLWQYWFTTYAERQRTGAWWRRELRGTFAPPLGTPP